MKLYHLLCLQTELPFQTQFQIKIDFLDSYLIQTKCMVKRENFNFSLIFIIKMTYSLISHFEDFIEITLIRTTV